ncbi:MAG: tetratricopeptide repeat protein [Capsulimonadales bacterium]|nr:tetratricopeptide repeat protein [Capsulimonadales bacterium]
MPPRIATHSIWPTCLLASSLLASAVGTPVRAQKNAPGLPPNAPAQNLGRFQVAPPPGLALFNRALEATKAGKYAEAERLYRKVVKDAPEAAAAWANLGLLVGRQERIKEAIEFLTRATRVSPETGAFWAQLSAFQLRGKQWKAAELSARKALARDAADLLAVANLSDALFQQRRYAEAAVILKKLSRMEGDPPTDHTEITLILALSGAGKAREALPLAQARSDRRPKDVQSFLLLGDTARRAGDIGTAEKAYRQASNLDPKHPGALAGISVTAAIRGDRTAALKLIDQRLAKEPFRAELYFQKGYIIYSDNTRPPEERLGIAEGAFRRAAALDPKNPQYLTYSGLVLMLRGPYPGLREDEEPPSGVPPYAMAENYLRGALTLNPKLTMARLALGSISEQRRKPAEAIAQYEAVLQYAPKDADAHRGIAGVHYAQGRKAKAYERMETIARLNPTDTQALSELASWYVADKRSDDAEKVYRRVLLRNPKDAPARLALGRMQEERKNLPGAATEYRAAVAGAPTDRNATLLLANVLQLQKKTADAIQVLREFLHRSPENNPIRWQLALLLKESGKTDEALAEMQQLTLKNDDPDRLTYLLSVPRLHLEAKRFDEAISTLLRLQTEHPKEDAIRYLLADAYERSDRKEKAEAVLREMVDRSADPTRRNAPPDPRPRLALAELYERSNAWDEAATLYEDVLRYETMNVTALFALSRVREKGNKPDAAVDFLTVLATANDREPSLPGVGAIHQLYLNQGKLDRYLEFTKALLAKYPENRNARYIRARSLTEGTPDENARREAASLYQAIVESNADDIEARRNLAKEWEALGRKDDAVGAYREILKKRATDTDALASLRRLGAS